MKTEKTTSKREFRFVTHALRNCLTIEDANANELREFDATKLSPEVRDTLIVHGLKQKMTDDTMVSKIGEDGDRLLACDELWTRLLAGEWEKERESVARPPEAMIRLVVELKRVSRVVAEASLKTAGKEKWDAIAKAHATRVGKIQEEIKAEKAKAEGIDLEDLS